MKKMVPVPARSLKDGRPDGPVDMTEEGSAEDDAFDPVAQKEMSGIIKSAKRVMELFDCFAECRRPLAVSDVVGRLDYPQSSASVLLKSLTKLGYLSYNRHTRLYMPTLRVALFGGWVYDDLYTQGNLSHLLDELHHLSGGKTVMVGMQNDIYAQYIYLVQQQSPRIPWYIKTGSLRPLCRSAIGRVLLSRKTDVEVQQLLWRINAEEPDVSLRMTVNELLRELDFIRARGYAYTEGAVNPLTGVVAVELPTPATQPPMAIGIGTDIESLRSDREEMLSLLNEALQPYRERLAGRARSEVRP